MSERLDSPYYQDPDIRCRIDEAMREAAFLMTRKGTRQQYTDRTTVHTVKAAKREGKQLVDDLPEDEIKKWYRKEENRLLKGVFKYDPQFIKALIIEED